MIPRRVDRGLWGGRAGAEIWAKPGLRARTSLEAPPKREGPRSVPGTGPGSEQTGPRLPGEACTDRRSWLPNNFRSGGIPLQQAASCLVAPSAPAEPSCRTSSSDTTKAKRWFNFQHLQGDLAKRCAARRRTSATVAGPQRTRLPGPRAQPRLAAATGESRRSSRCGGCSGEVARAARPRGGGGSSPSPSSSLEATGRRGRRARRWGAAKGGGAPPSGNAGSPASRWSRSGGTWGTSRPRAPASPGRPSSPRGQPAARGRRCAPGRGRRRRARPRRWPRRTPSDASRASSSPIRGSTSRSSKASSPAPCTRTGWGATRTGATPAHRASRSSCPRFRPWGTAGGP